MSEKPDWDALFAYIDYFEGKPEMEPPHAVKRPDGVLSLHSTTYSDDVGGFLRLFYSMEIVDYNYMETVDTYREMMQESPFNAFVEEADKGFCLAWLTYFIRGDRFVDGMLATAISQGTISAILKRLRTIIQEE